VLGRCMTYCATVLTTIQKHGPLIELSVSRAVEKKRDPKEELTGSHTQYRNSALGPPLGNMMIEIYRLDGEAL
jgi:hypothetical protein